MISSQPSRGSAALATRFESGRTPSGFWDYVTQSPLADIIADLVGPDVKFHHSKLNYKWAQGGEEVKWHYDISFWPHTNYSPLTVGTYLYTAAWTTARSA